MIPIHKSNAALQIHSRLPFHAGRSNPRISEPKSILAKLIDNADIQQAPPQVPVWRLRSFSGKSGYPDIWPSASSRVRSSRRQPVREASRRRHITCPNRLSQENLFFLFDRRINVSACSAFGGNAFSHRPAYPFRGTSAPAQNDGNAGWRYKSTVLRDHLPNPRMIRKPA